MKKKRYAIVGVSGRSASFTESLMNTYKDRSEIVALLDSNPNRMTSFNQDHQLNLPCFGPDDFDRMVSETHPDSVIISSVDSTHHTYIIAALRNGIESICEKPMTTDEEKVRAILKARKESTAPAYITFNYRYGPVRTKIKEMLKEGKVGTVTHVDFNYFLDTFHGASYFKRWNRYEKLAGSLLVTKASHHFDLMNWWLDDRPAEVFCYGKLNYYGPNGTHNPEKVNGRRCSTCNTKCKYYLRHSSTSGNASEDEHLINFNNPGKNELYAQSDGYYADRCIFDDDIDTWDTFVLSVRYESGALMSYSLNASLPYEGYRVAINGTEGRIETNYIAGKVPRTPFPVNAPPQDITYFPLFDGMQTINVINRGGGHGGGDPIIKRDLFSQEPNDNYLGLVAGVEDGAYAALLGIAARISLKSGKPVKIADLLQG